MSLISSELVIVSEEDPSCRIDAFLSLKFPDHSRTYFQYLIENNYIKVNGSPVKKREKLLPGDSLEIIFYSKEPLSAIPQEMSLNILYEDEFFLAINKPRDLVVHPAPGNPNNTLVNGLLYHYKDLESQDPIRPGIVHRLDKDTSGALLIAKTKQAHERLSLAFKERLIHKEYLALCLGNPGSKTLKNRLGRDPNDRKKITILEEKGKEAITQIETLHYRDGYSLVKILPFTGRTHQIRVHLHSTGCPVLGDPLYGSPRSNQKLELDVQMLHAHILRFKHPFKETVMTIEAEMPDDMKELKKRLLLTF